MRRREFIAGLGSAAAWPLAASAQSMRRVGMLMNLAPDDVESQPRMTAFVKRLHQSGWTEGLNVRIDTRWAAAEPERFRRYAAELVALAPDAILASTSPSVAALQRATGTVPIVFANVTDPVGQGFVASLSRPGGNVTGFSVYEYGIAPKWLELLKELAPNVRRVAVLRDASLVASGGLLGAIQGVASSFALEVVPLGLRGSGEIERGINTFAEQPQGGLIVLATPLSAAHRDLIIRLAARHRLPTIFPSRFFVTSGGLICYGSDIVDQYRHATGYIDRILKGEKPADLPVQAPTKYELVINLKTAKALGIAVPPMLLARADEVIE